MGRARHAATILAVSGLVLILLEEMLFPQLSRPLALFSLAPPPADRSLLLLILKAALIGVFIVAEWPFVALLLSMVAEMYNQPGDFKRRLLLHPRAQSPRVALALLLLVLGATGLIQPLFFLWWVLGILWGAVLLWLTGQEFYGWRGPGNIILVVGYVLFQGLVLLIYFILR